MNLSTLLALVALSLPAAAQTCGTTPNSVGAGAVLKYDGHADTGLAVLHAAGVPAGHFGVMIHSPISTPPLPWGEGTLCVQPFVSGAGMLPVIQADADGVCIMLGVPETLPGQFVQLWYRDPEVGTFNLSNSIKTEPVGEQ